MYHVQCAHAEYFRHVGIGVLRQKRLSVHSFNKHRERSARWEPEYVDQQSVHADFVLRGDFFLAGVFSGTRLWVASTPRHATVVKAALAQGSISWQS